MHTVLPHSSQDKSADFSSSSSVGQKNKLLAKTVMGLYEVIAVRIIVPLKSHTQATLPPPS